MMTGTKAAKVNAGKVNGGVGLVEVKPLKLSEHLYQIRKDLLQGGIKVGPEGLALPKVDLSSNYQLGLLIQKRGLSLETVVTPHGPLTPDELMELDTGENEGKHPGLRNGYKVEYQIDGEEKLQYILLISTGSGMNSGVLVGQSPMIKVIAQPGTEQHPLINVRTLKSKSKGRKVNGRETDAGVQAVV